MFIHKKELETAISIFEKVCSWAKNKTLNKNAHKCEVKVREMLTRFHKKLLGSALEPEDLKFLQTEFPLTLVVWINSKEPNTNCDDPHEGGPSTVI